MVTCTWNNLVGLTMLGNSANIVSCPSRPKGLFITIKRYPGAVVFFCIRHLKIIVKIRANRASRIESRWKMTKTELKIRIQLLFPLIYELCKTSFMINLIKLTEFTYSEEVHCLPLMVNYNWFAVAGEIERKCWHNTNSVFHS